MCIYAHSTYKPIYSYVSSRIVNLHSCLDIVIYVGISKYRHTAINMCMCVCIYVHVHRYIHTKTHLQIAFYRELSKIIFSQIASPF